MRDIALTLFVFGCLPFIFRRPWIGILLWTWISLMSPHLLTWGFAYHIPFAQIVAIVTLLAAFFTRETKRIPWNPLTVVWLLFVLWMPVTTVFALVPEDALMGLEKSMKIHLFCFLTLMFISSQDRLKWYIWVVALSIGFYGIKGGVFTIATGGNFTVWGPGGFVGGNNEIAFALIAIFPLLRFLQLHAENKWVSRALGVSMVLCAASIIGSQSRGAFLAIIAMAMFLVWKSRKRVLIILVMLLIVPLGVGMLPQKYWARMETIKDYQTDASAMGRLNAWGFALNLVNDHPITGGGFNTFSPQLFKIYAPNPNDHHDVHSIWFEILGEQGWVGFFLYLMLGILAYRYSGWTIRRARGDPELTWHEDLARMTQVCIVGYAVGGTFLGLAYFDLYYDIVAIIVINRMLLERRLAERPRVASHVLGPLATPSPAPPLGIGSARTQGGR